MTCTGKAGAAPSVVITGAAGYIGSHICLAFLERGWTVTAVDDLSTGSRSVVPPAARFIEMDCADPALVDVLESVGADAMIHMAARISVDESVADPLGYYRANLSNAERCFSSAARAGIKAIVFSSTAAVYGETGPAPASEADPTNPVSPYGRSKLAAEWILRDLAAASDIRHVILRYFNVAGADPAGRAGPRAGAGHLMKRACEAAIGLRPQMAINGTDYATPDGTCVRDYIHVCDLATAHVAAVEHLVGGGESLMLNCGYGSGFSVADVLEVALRLADTPFEIVKGPRRAGDPEAVVADARMLRSKLAWTPRHHGLETILRTGMAWERQRLTAPA
jgi:UDP-glucose 4-epimerase